MDNAKEVYKKSCSLFKERKRLRRLMMNCQDSYLLKVYTESFLSVAKKLTELCFENKIAYAKAERTSFPLPAKDKYGDGSWYQRQCILLDTQFNPELRKKANLQFYGRLQSKEEKNA